MLLIPTALASVPCCDHLIIACHHSRTVGHQPKYWEGEYKLEEDNELGYELVENSWGRFSHPDPWEQPVLHTLSGRWLVSWRGLEDFAQSWLLRAGVTSAKVCPEHAVGWESRSNGIMDHEIYWLRAPVTVTCAGNAAPSPPPSAMCACDMVRLTMVYADVADAVRRALRTRLCAPDARADGSDLESALEGDDDSVCDLRFSLLLSPSAAVANISSAGRPVYYHARGYYLYAQASDAPRGDMADGGTRLVDAHWHLAGEDWRHAVPTVMRSITRQAVCPTDASLYEDDSGVRVRTVRIICTADIPSTTEASAADGDGDLLLAMATAASWMMFFLFAVLFEPCVITGVRVVVDQCMAAVTAATGGAIVWQQHNLVGTAVTIILLGCLPGDWAKSGVVYFVGKACLHHTLKYVLAFRHNFPGRPTLCWALRFPFLLTSVTRIVLKESYYHYYLYSAGPPSPPPSWPPPPPPPAVATGWLLDEIDPGWSICNQDALISLVIPWVWLRGVWPVILDGLFQFITSRDDGLLSNSFQLLIIVLPPAFASSWWVTTSFEHAFTRAGLHVFTHLSFVLVSDDYEAILSVAFAMGHAYRCGAMPGSHWVFLGHLVACYCFLRLYTFEKSLPRWLAYGAVVTLLCCFKLW